MIEECIMTFELNLPCIIFSLILLILLLVSIVLKQWSLLLLKSLYYHLQEAAGLQNIENQNLTLVTRSKWRGVVGVCSVVVLWVWDGNNKFGLQNEFDVFFRQTITEDLKSISTASNTVLGWKKKLVMVNWIKMIFCNNFA